MEKGSHILVVDDRIEDGEAIVRRLWKDQFPVLFHNYDAEHPLTPENVECQHCGIRVIFQDILLIPGKGSPGHQDYGAAWNVLESLLSDDNGPWLMVAWSTWAEDPDEGGKYARELFDFLQERLSSGKKPYNYVVLDKQPYTADGAHDAVKQEHELSAQEKNDLHASIHAELSNVPALSVLVGWESDIKKAASNIVNDLWGLVELPDDQSIKDKEARLLQLLFKLGMSQDGRLMPSDNIAGPVYELLATLLSDRLTTLPNRNINHAFTGEDPGIDSDLINTMLHWDGLTDKKQNPGAVLVYPDGEKNVDIISFSSSKRKHCFVVDQFVPKSKHDDVKHDTNLFDNITMVMLDITPPCDHANRKAGWRRYILGIKVKGEYVGHFYNGKKLANEALKATPNFSYNDERFVLIFSSRLICSIPDQEKKFKDISVIGRLKEQLLRDIASWNGGMSARPGIVSV